MKTPYLECGNGWLGIIQPLIDYCEQHNILITQIKEKLGHLRFYHGPAPAEFNLMVREAMEKSKVTCELCGQPGKLNVLDGWYSTRCKEHRETNS